MNVKQFRRLQSLFKNEGTCIRIENDNCNCSGCLIHKTEYRSFGCLKDIAYKTAVSLLNELSEEDILEILVGDL